MARYEKDVELIAAIRHMRKEAKMSSTELASASRITRQTLYNKMAGVTHFTWNDVKTLLNVMGYEVVFRKKGSK